MYCGNLTTLLCDVFFPTEGPTPSLCWSSEYHGYRPFFSALIIHPTGSLAFPFPAPGTPEISCSIPPLCIPAPGYAVASRSAWTPPADFQSPEFRPRCPERRRCRFVRCLAGCRCRLLLAASGRALIATLGRFQSRLSMRDCLPPAFHPHLQPACWGVQSTGVPLG